MDVISNAYSYTNSVLYYAFLALHVWGVADCLIRRSAAFPAADKLTKPAWLLILVLSGVFGMFIPPIVGVISLVSVVVVAVYLADVRPAVREISGG